MLIGKEIKAKPYCYTDGRTFMKRGHRFVCDRCGWHDECQHGLLYSVEKMDSSQKDYLRRIEKYGEYKESNHNI